MPSWARVGRLLHDFGRETGSAASWECPPSVGAEVGAGFVFASDSTLTAGSEFAVWWSSIIVGGGTPVAPAAKRDGPAMGLVSSALGAQGMRTGSNRPRAYWRPNSAHDKFGRRLFRSSAGSMVGDGAGIPGLSSDGADRRPPVPSRSFAMAWSGVLWSARLCCSASEGGMTRSSALCICAADGRRRDLDTGFTPISGNEGAGEGVVRGLILGLALALAFVVDVVADCDEDSDCWE